MPRGKRRSLIPTKFDPVENLDDDTVVDLLQADTDPVSTVASVARKAGLSETATKKLLQPLRARYAPVERKLRQVKVSQLVELLEDTAYEALSQLTPEALAEASPRDRAIIAGVMIDKRQLLKGEPTVILSVEERMELGQLMDALIKEKERRGMIIDAHADEVIVENSDPNRAIERRKALPMNEWHRVRNMAAMEDSGEAAAIREADIA